MLASQVLCAKELNLELQPVSSLVFLTWGIAQLLWVNMPAHSVCSKIHVQIQIFAFLT